MKRFLVTFALVFSFLSMQAADISTISNAFSSGNASGLSSAMDSEVDVAIPGSSKKTNGNDAVALLNRFFSGNKPTGFSVVHHADKNESGFFVGKLMTANKEYRVNVTYRTENNKAIIQSIRIE
ncbi:DUF4783 domain-containing protein [Parabacteroides sp. PF5-9]|uniref:DUF4783 domain-containing protein n=1 Tax=Parabacteroides sp. PF5-9 TaxID=1742404 RepID=UPI0024763587|nr:DUF4783 domain-containing protein [Parabacteroides sp. PF5-9]MDH6358128.1 hypothetical protein [Parabacteroides sp. PF5-9]